MKRAWAAVALFCVAGVSVGGCSVPPDHVEGAVGVSASSAGDPVVHFFSCGSPIVRVSVSLTREGLADDEPNPVVGEWVLTEPVTVGSVNLGTSPVTSSDLPAVRFEKGTNYLADVESSEPNERVTGPVLMFDLADLPAAGSGMMFDGEELVRVGSTICT